MRWHTQQVSREASSGADELGAIHLPQLVSHIGMQLLIQRFYLEAEEEKKTIFIFHFALFRSLLLNREPWSSLWQKAPAGNCTPNLQLSFAPCLRAQALNPDSSHRSSAQVWGREHCWLSCWSIKDAIYPMDLQSSFFPSLWGPSWSLNSYRGRRVMCVSSHLFLLNPCWLRSASLEQVSSSFITSAREPTTSKHNLQPRWELFLPLPAQMSFPHLQSAGHGCICNFLETLLHNLLSSSLHSQNNL